MCAPQSKLKVAKRQKWPAKKKLELEGECVNEKAQKECSRWKDTFYD